jgi:hypothetical protein
VGRSPGSKSGRRVARRPGWRNPSPNNLPAPVLADSQHQDRKAIIRDELGEARESTTTVTPSDADMHSAKAEADSRGGQNSLSGGSVEADGHAVMETGIAPPMSPKNGNSADASAEAETETPRGSSDPSSAQTISTMKTRVSSSSPAPHNPNDPDCSCFHCHIKSHEKTQPPINDLSPANEPVSTPAGNNPPVPVSGSGDRDQTQSPARELAIAGLITLVKGHLQHLDQKASAQGGLLGHERDFFARATFLTKQLSS